MPVITEITPQKKKTNIFNIFVEGEFFCALSDLELANSNLHVGQEIKKSDLNQLKKQALQSKAYNRAVYFLSFRPRSHREVETYLKKLDYDQSTIDFVVSKLEKNNLLNDEQFITNWIDYRKLVKPTSKRRLEQELLAKGIDRLLIRNALESIGQTDELETIKQIVNKKLRQQKYKNPAKLTQYLLRQGFNYQDIKDVLQN